MGELFEVRVESAVRLPPVGDPGGGGEAARIREWQVAVTARSRRLDSIAIVVDFRKLRARIDHALSEIDAGPAAEIAGSTSGAHELARWLLARLRDETGDADYWIDAVEVRAEESILVRVRA